MALSLTIFAPVERMIAWRYLRPRRKEGFVSVIAGFAFAGIALGVATLIVVMSVMNGFRAELLARILGFNAHMVVVGVGTNLSDYESLAERVRKVRGVTSAVPVIDGQVMIASRAQTSGALVRGIAPADMKGHRLLADQTSPGAVEAFEGNAVIVGARLAAELRVTDGDRIRLISSASTTTPFGPVPRVRTFTVVGTFRAGMSEFDRAYVFIPLDAAQDYFQIPGEISNIELTVGDPDRVEEVAQRIVAERIPNIRIRTWQDQHRTFFNALKVERNVMFLILTLIIVVAAFNIISSMIMLVKDKGPAIAILRTMGATRGSVMRIFFLSGASIGVCGTLLGVGLGLLIADNIDAIKGGIERLTGGRLFPDEIYFLSQLPAVIDATDVLQVALMGIGLSFLATLYPSWRASRLDPVEALRNE